MILDTNALSALGDREPALIHFLENNTTAVLCFISLAEYHRGLLGSTRPERGYEMLAALTAALQTLCPNQETSSHYAEIGHFLKTAGRPIPTNDLWIAALARQHSLPILSRDRHFDYIPEINRLSWQ